MERWNSPSSQDLKFHRGQSFRGHVGSDRLGNVTEINQSGEGLGESRAEVLQGG